jgi:nicotinamide-nucleotide amidase
LGAAVTDLAIKAKELLDLCLRETLMLAVAESCTGGMVAAALTAIPGSSRVLERGFVTYSNAAKAEMLDVPSALILRHGAVSEEVARAMANGALARSRASASLAITGIAGPDGGSLDKPVGTVHIAVALAGKPTLHEAHHFTGDRDAVRRQAAVAAMDLLARGITRRA